MPATTSEITMPKGIGKYITEGRKLLNSLANAGEAATYLGNYFKAQSKGIRATGKAARNPFGEPGGTTGVKTQGSRRSQASRTTARTAGEPVKSTRKRLTTGAGAGRKQNKQMQAASKPRARRVKPAMPDAPEKMPVAA